ncbi:MAG: HD domain-containing protein [Candidatus Omnitrophica bacterium]|nr:HD domain-containing protein [Candidatus Omnitrophota bacterium]
MNPKIKIESLSTVSLQKKFSVAFILMSLVPILLILFIIHYFQIVPLVEKQLPFFNITILLVVLLSLASFDLVRRSMVSLSRISKNAAIIASGNYDKRVEHANDEEIGQLANSFNKITAELQNKIKQLEQSKKLLQHILNKIGSAVTSTKGIENLLELILQTLIQGTEARSGAIYIVNNEKNRLVMRVSFGVFDPAGKTELAMDQGLTGKALGLKTIETASDIKENALARFEYENKLARESIVVSPLICKDDTLGVIILCDKTRGRSFSSDDTALLSNVSAQTAIAIENFLLNEDAEKTYLETVTALAVAVEAKDPYSRGHIDRVSDYAQRLGREMGLDEEMMKILKNGAVLHDVGKIGVRDEVLKKQGPLNEEEQKEMRQHVIIGVNIIKPIRSMSALSDLVRYHQELYDGTGYPDGLKGEEIPLSARIIKICDAYDAMTTDRPYRKGMSRDDAKKEIEKKSGIEFDPGIVKSFLNVI